MKNSRGSKLVTLFACTTVLCSLTAGLQSVAAFAQETEQQVAVTEKEWPEWSDLGKFGEKDTNQQQVKHNGKIWQAKWWLTSDQAKEPGSAADYTTGWQEVGQISADGTVTLKAEIKVNPLGSEDQPKNSDVSGETEVADTVFDPSEWPEWSELKEYGANDTKGFQVKHNDAVYESLWWTNQTADVEPGTAEETTTGWKKIGTIDENGQVQLNRDAKKNPLQVSTADPTTPYSRINAGQGKSWDAQVFSPYIDSGLWYSGEGYQGLYPLGKEQEKSNIKYANIGFIVADPKNPKTASFGGYYNVDGTGENGAIVAGFADQIRQFREKGGDVMPSFGGENGTPLHKAIEDEHELANKYIEIIEKYGFTAIDFDIEGSHVRDKTAWQRNNRALKIMQEKLGDQAPKVWFTFPVLPTGLVGEGTDNDAYNVLKDAVNSGVAVQGVNVMTMCFGPAFVKEASQEYYKFVVEASESLKKQIQTIYRDANLELNDQQAYQKVGLTPWIGKSSQANETFTQNDAKELQKYAAEKGVGMLSFWSLNRDQNIKEDLKNPGIAENGAYEFSSILNEFNVPAAATKDTPLVSPEVTAKETAKAVAETTPTKPAAATATKTASDAALQLDLVVEPVGSKSKVSLVIPKEVFQSSKNIQVLVNDKYSYSTEKGVNYYSQRATRGDQIYISRTMQVAKGDKIKVLMKNTDAAAAKVVEEITVTEAMLAAGPGETFANTKADLVIAKTADVNQIVLNMTNEEFRAPWNYEVYYNDQYLFSTENGEHYYAAKKVNQDGKNVEIAKKLKLKAGDVVKLIVRDPQNTANQRVLKEIKVTKEQLSKSKVDLDQAKGELSVVKLAGDKSRVQLKLDKNNYQSPIDFTVSVNGNYLFHTSQKVNYYATLSFQDGYQFSKEVSLAEGDQVQLVAKDHYDKQAPAKVLKTLKVKAPAKN